MEIRPDDSVSLSEVDLRFVAFAALSRQTQNAFRDRQNAQHMETCDWCDQPSFDRHVMGAVAEFVASLVLNVAWYGPGMFRGDDIGGRIEVRAHGNAEMIRVMPEDPAWKPVVGVVVSQDKREGRAFGWVFAGEAQELEKTSRVPGRRAVHWHKGPFRPMRELREWLGRKEQARAF